MTATRARLLLLLVLLAGGLLRFQGNNWDDGTHLHPDERFLTMVVADLRAPGSVAEFFDTAHSPMNPATTGRGFFVYGTLPLFVVKAVSSVLGRGGYDQVHLVGRAVSALVDTATIALTFELGMVLAGPVVALGAAALLAFSVTAIQHAHFFTVDTFAACFATASVLLLAFVMRSGRLHWHLLFGTALGLTLACRANLFPLAALYAIVLIHAWVVQRRSAATLVASGALATVAGLLVFRICQPYAFGPGLFSLSLSRDFVQSLDVIRTLTTGAADFPPSVQWIGRLPLVFQGWNLLVWGLGPAWGISAAVAVPVLLAGRHAGARLPTSSAARVVLLWAPLLFVFHGVQFTTPVRYLLPLVPTLAVAVALFLLERGGAAAWRRRLFAAVLVLTALWAVAFTSVYRRPHTRVDASRWLYEHVAPGSAIATEHWDDGLPLGLGRAPADLYRRLELTLYDEEDDGKRTRLLETLHAADVIVISSNRLYRSIPRTPWRYPLARRYYELLFSGELGFALEQVFTSYPTLAGITLRDDDAEEPFTVFDHPKVLVFRKSATYDHARVSGLLQAVSLAGIMRVPPREASALYRQMRPGDLDPPEGPERVPVGADDSAETGSLEALARWAVSFELLSLAAFALLFGWLVEARDRGFAIARLVAWLGPATIVWWLASVGLAANSASTARAVAALCIASGAAAFWRRRDELLAFCRRERRLLLTIEAVFAGGFLLIVLIRAFNPAIFWGEKPMDFALLNALMRSAGMPPADPWFAGERLNYFYLGHAGVAIFAKLTGVPAAIAFNLALATLGALLATLVCTTALYATGGVRAGLFAAAAVVAVGNLAGVRTLLTAGWPALGFDYYWSTSRVIPGTINEYPFWNLLFGDLHAHVLAMPLQAGVVCLGALWLVSTAPRALWVLGGLSALAIGATAVTSSWSLPTVAVLQLGFLLTRWWRGPRTVRRLATAAVTWVGIVGASHALFWPFHATYVRPPLGWGVGTEFAALADVLTIFGIVTALTLPALGWVAVRHVSASGRWRGLLLALLAALVVVGAVTLRSAAAGFYACWIVIGLAVWLADDHPPLQVAGFLVASAGGLGLITEAVFVWDRMNTVFKYYLDMWLLMGVAAALVTAWTLARAPHALRRGLLAAGALIVSGGVFTSATALAGFLREPRARSSVPTLDGADYLRGDSAAERDAFAWLNREVTGIPVLLEAQGPPYQAFARVAMHTGLPTVLGWPYHLVQQGRPQALLDARAADVRELYDTTDLKRADRLLRAYNIDLVFVGPLERRTYAAAGLAKFATMPQLQPVFHNRDVTIYATAGRASAVKTWVDAVPLLPPSVPMDAPLREPRALAAAPDGTIVVADFGNRRVQRLSGELAPVAAFGMEGAGPGEFKDPCAIAVDADGMVWVADTWNHRIQKLSPTGEPLLELRGDLYGPRGIAPAADGSVYVTDTGHHRVVRLAPGEPARVVTSAGQLENPIGIAFDARGEIYVADVGHRRIAVFDTTGQLLRAWPMESWANIPRMEPSLAVGPDGIVWAVDPAGREVRLFSRDGEPRGRLTAEGLAFPLGISLLDARTAVVADAATGRVVRLERDDADQGSAGAGASPTRLQTPTRKSPTR